MRKIAEARKVYHAATGSVSRPTSRNACRAALMRGAVYPDRQLSGPRRWRSYCKSIARTTFRRLDMLLWILVAIFFVLWLIGIAMHVASAAIHVLLVIAIVLFIVRLFTGRTPRPVA
jgi:hypothetical protein